MSKHGHSLLSPSSAHRWISCPPSAMLNARAPDGHNVNAAVAAAEGTAAHSLCEFRLKRALGIRARDPTEDLDYFDETMSKAADSYVKFILEQIETAQILYGDPIILIEEKLDFSDWVPEGFGTGDCVIVTDGMLSVIDFKYGIGVPVSAYQNPQLLCYALGAVSRFQCIYDNIQRISVTIFQPRRNITDTYTLGIDELLDWADNTLKPAAALAAQGEGELFADEENCRFCGVKGNCAKYAEFKNRLAYEDFSQPY